MFEKVPVGTGTATIRWSRPSKSMATGSFFSSLAGPSPGFFSLSFASLSFASLPFSSSLSFANGDTTPFLSTTRYSDFWARMSALDCANHWFTGPASVELKKYRYLPEESNTGSVASDRPSVTRFDWPDSADQTWTVRYAALLPSA